MIRFDYCKYWLKKARENIHNENYVGARAFIVTTINEINTVLQSGRSVK